MYGNRGPAIPHNSIRQNAFAGCYASFACRLLQHNLFYIIFSTNLNIAARSMITRGNIGGAIEKYLFYFKSFVWRALIDDRKSNIAKQSEMSVQVDGMTFMWKSKTPKHRSLRSIQNRFLNSWTQKKTIIKILRHMCKTRFGMASYNPLNSSNPLLSHSHIEIQMKNMRHTHRRSFFLAYFEKAFSCERSDICLYGKWTVSRKNVNNRKCLEKLSKEEQDMMYSSYYSPGRHCRPRTF